MITKSKACIFKLKALSATKHPIDIDNFVPITYLQTSKHAHWTQAMLEEFQALQTTSTWTLISFVIHYCLLVLLTLNQIAPYLCIPVIPL